MVAAFAQAFSGAVRQIPRPNQMLNVEDQAHLRDEVVQHLREHEDTASLAHFVGVGLLGARVLFGDEQGNILIPRIEALPQVLRNAAPELNPIFKWLENGADGELPFEAVTRAGGIFGDYLAQRAPLDASFIEDSLRFTQDLVPETEEYLTYVPLIYAVKYFITGKSNTRIAGDSWQVLLETGADAYAASWLVRTQVLANPNSWKSDAFQTGLRSAVTTIFDVLARISRHHPSDTISFDIFDQLIVAGFHFADLNAIKLPITAPTLGRTLRPFFRYVLGGRDVSASGRLARGLTLPSIRRAKSEFLNWSVTQGWIETTFLQRIESTQLDEKTLPTQALLAQAQTLQNRSYSAGPGATLENLLDSFPRLLTVGETTLFFAANQRDLHTRGFDELSMLNILKTLLKLLAEGYTSQTDQQPAFLTRVEIQRGMEDFFPLLSELHLTAPTDSPDGLAQTLTGEGNLFPSQANGDGVMQQGEGIEMLLHVMSARTIKDRIIEALSDAGCGPIDPRVKIDPPLHATSVREKLFHQTSIFTSQLTPYMPRMIAEFNSYSEAERARFFNALEKIGRSGSNFSEPFTPAYLQRIVNVLQFAESVYQRLDLDWSNVIERQEAMAAFPLFKRPLQEASGKTGYELEAIFGYILRYGIPPRKPDHPNPFANLARATGYFGWLLNWKIVGASGVDIQLTRLKLVTLFAELSSAPH